jgi:hypothetical protein
MEAKGIACLMRSRITPEKLTISCLYIDNLCPLEKGTGE